MRTLPRFLLPDPYLPLESWQIIMLNGGYSAPAAANWPSANRGIIVPVVFPCSATLYALYARGNNTTGNYDLAFYDDAYNRLASKGSTAMAAAILTLTLPETRVHAGRLYYAAMACSSASSSVFRGAASDSSARQLIGAGMGQQASALALPDPFVPAILTSDYVPLFAFGVR